jgi:hypothetical protein
LSRSSTISYNQQPFFPGLREQGFSACDYQPIAESYQIGQPLKAIIDGFGLTVRGILHLGFHTCEESEESRPEGVAFHTGARFDARRGGFCADRPDRLRTEPLLNIRDEIGDSADRDRVQAIGLLGKASQHEEENIEHFETRGVQFSSNAQPNAHMLVFDVTKEACDFR